MTSKISIDNRELLQKISNGEAAAGIDFGNAIVRELAAFRLAAMDSEPSRNPVLAYADSYRDMAKQGVESVPIWSVITDLERNIAPLYRQAQPAPVVQENSDPRDAFEAVFPMPKHAQRCGDGYAVTSYGAWTAYEFVKKWEGWNACRAAMLQEIQKSAGASNNCRSNENVQVVQDVSRCSTKAAPALDSSPKTAESRCGNSPVIPADYVMVPREPTKEMIDAGWLHFMGTKNPSSKGTYKAMLAAAPQEVKSES